MYSIVKFFSMVKKIEEKKEYEYDCNEKEIKREK